MISVRDAAKALINAVGILKTLGDERRAKLAEYFDKICSVLDTFVQKKRNGEKTGGICKELAQYAESLREIASPTLSEEKLNSLTSGLSNACAAWDEMNLTEESDSQSFEEYLKELEDASGLFRGAANVLRAK